MLCECGCKNVTNKGKRFIKGHNNRRKEKKRIHPNGYVSIKVGGYVVSEHKHVWEKSNGKVPKNFVIHHKNGNKKDNRLENLDILSLREHSRKHLLPNRRRTRYLNSIKVERIDSKI